MFVQRGQVSRTRLTTYVRWEDPYSRRERWSRASLSAHTPRLYTHQSDYNKQTITGHSATCTAYSLVRLREPGSPGDLYADSRRLPAAAEIEISISPIFVIRCTHLTDLIQRHLVSHETAERRSGYGSTRATHSRLARTARPPFSIGPVPGPQPVLRPNRHPRTPPSPRLHLSDAGMPRLGPQLSSSPLYYHSDTPPNRRPNSPADIRPGNVFALLRAFLLIAHN